MADSVCDATVSKSCSESSLCNAGFFLSIARVGLVAGSGFDCADQEASVVDLSSVPLSADAGRFVGRREGAWMLL